MLRKDGFPYGRVSIMIIPMIMRLHVGRCSFLIFFCEDINTDRLDKNRNKIKPRRTSREVIVDLFYRVFAGGWSK